ncbi:hypothetical protein CC80DRAFT_30587 [Byssothecium circinans]|uniref:Uncharacterized protein n=1 Tax=Byssothecium circinans TaxID=147558 RepID=A0A6A5U0P0_9PLEO|nr:hypothetical protein CC80DRAFT_30587 [Byssothecium circinans]
MTLPQHIPSAKWLPWGVLANSLLLQMHEGWTQDEAVTHGAIDRHRNRSGSRYLLTYRTIRANAVCTDVRLTRCLSAQCREDC